MAGVVLIMIEWTVCDQSGDGTCTRGVTPVLATTTLPPNATTTLADLVTVANHPILLLPHQHCPSTGKC
jgi:hypothetical protein